MDDILMRFNTDQGTANSLKLLAEKHNKTVPELINQICQEYIHKEMMGMLDNIKEAVKNK